MSRNETDQLSLDHITVVANTLNEGAEYIQKFLGVEVPFGGRHPAMGTHNRLMRIGEDCFLELIATDPNAQRPMRARWFDLDRFAGSPRLETWVVGTHDIQLEIERCGELCGPATLITRGELTWLISVAEDGSLPLAGAFPTLIEWPAGDHPARKMPDLGCRLRSLTIEHPQADRIAAHFNGRIKQEEVFIRRASRKRLLAEIDTPYGPRVLT